jgi:hypothetical protein
MDSETKYYVVLLVSRRDKSENRASLLFFAHNCISLTNSTKEAFGSKGSYRPNSSVNHPSVTVRSETWLCATIVAALHSNNGRK